MLRQQQDEECKQRQIATQAFDMDLPPSDDDEEYCEYDSEEEPEMDKFGNYIIKDMKNDVHGGANGDAETEKNS